MTLQLTTLRCSALPRAFRCAASLHDGELRIDAAGDEAALGTATHELLAQAVRGDVASAAALDADLAAVRHGVDRDELGRLTYFGVQAWHQLRESYPEPIVEELLTAEFRSVTLTGHIDVLSVRSDARKAALLDWKTGYKDADYLAQLTGYAVLVALNHPTVEAVTATIAWLRPGEIETYAFTRRELFEWQDRLLAEVVAWDGATYRPGGHCAGCRRAHDCPARTAMVRAAVADLTGGEMAQRLSSGLSDLPGPAAADIYARVQLIERACEAFRDALRERVAVSGPIDTGRGSHLALVETQRSRIDALKGWHVIDERLNDGELADCITVHKSKLEDAVARKAGRGRGAAAKRQLIAELEAAGALDRFSIFSLRELRGAPSAPTK